MRTRSIVWMALACASWGVARGQDYPATPAEVSEIARVGQKHATTLPTSQQLTSVPEDFSKAGLAPGYLLQLEVYVSQTLVLAPQLTVSSHGDIFVPYVGEVHVGGESVATAQAQIAKELEDHRLYVHPQVVLNVLRYVQSSVTVLGEVQSPGTYQLLTPHDLTDVIGLAGGETVTSDGLVEIRHHLENGTITIRTTRNRDLPMTKHLDAFGNETIEPTIVTPGDTILVHRAGVVYVLGAVGRPGGYLMINHGKLTVAQAIALAGGTNVVASSGSVVITRADGSSKPMIIDLKKIVRGKAPATELRGDDIVFVPTNGFKAALIESSTLIASAAGAAIYRVP